MSIETELRKMIREELARALKKFYSRKTGEVKTEEVKTEEVKTEEDETEEDETEEDETEGKSVSIDDVRRDLNRLRAVKSQKVAVGIIRKYGTGGLSQIPESYYEKIRKDIAKEMLSDE